MNISLIPRSGAIMLYQAVRQLSNDISTNGYRSAAITVNLVIHVFREQLVLMWLNEALRCYI